MKTSKKILLLVLVVVMTMSVFATGCGKGEDVKEGEKPVVKDETPKATGPKVLRLAGMPAATFNPHTSESAEDSVLISYIYGGLLELVYNPDEEKAEFIPNHAEALPETEDNKVWTFTLKDGLKWTDGTPITAEDYEYFKGEVEWEEVGIKALDEKTLEITLDTEMPEIDVLTTFAGGGATSPVHKELYEAGMNEDRTETDYATTLEKVPSCGTYKLTEWIRDQNRVFEKNEDAILGDIYKPDRIESRVITESATRLQLFENGELDTATVSGSEYDKYQEDPRVVFQERNTVWGFFVNSTSEKNPILQNNDLRKALFYGIDRDKITKGVFKVYESTPYYISSIPMVDYENGTKYCDTEEAKAIRPEGSGFDPELAKEYFEKAYEANGNKKIEIEIIYFEAQETMKRMTEVAEEEYEGLFGSDKLDIKLRAMPPQAAYDAYRDGNFDMGIGAYTQDAFNPWGSMFVWTTDFPNKSHRFANEEFDKLYERTTRGDLLLDPKGRIEALAKMEEMLIDYVPQVPIFQNNNAQVFADRIKLITNGKFIPGLGFAELQADIVD